MKSKPYDVADSERESLKFQDAFNDAALKNGDAVDGQIVDIAEIRWWEQFPKRWVIVLLCFSAFLLCNMDRVSFYKDNHVLYL